MARQMCVATSRIRKLCVPTVPVIDGWSANGTHFLAIFASFPEYEAHSYELLILAFSPPENERTLRADGNIYFITYVLSMLQEKWIKIHTRMIASKCLTNKAIADDVSVRLIDCVNHTYKLAVRDLLLNEGDVILKMHALMSKLTLPLVCEAS